MGRENPRWGCTRVEERADRIGEFWGNPKTRTFAELLIDCKEDRTLRAVLVVMRERGASRSGAVAGRTRELAPHDEPAV
jgi:hypothetical protein